MDGAGRRTFKTPFRFFCLGPLEKGGGIVARRPGGNLLAWSHSLDSGVFHWTRVAELRPVTLSPSPSSL